MSYRLTNAAERDLLSIILQGIERFGEGRAQAYHAMLQRRFEALGKRPQMAASRDGLPAHIRVAVSGRHVILYRTAEGGGIVILRIRHGREDWVSDPL